MLRRMRNSRSFISSVSPGIAFRVGGSVTPFPTAVPRLSASVGVPHNEADNRQIAGMTPLNIVRFLPKGKRLIRSFSRYNAAIPFDNRIRVCPLRTYFQVRSSNPPQTQYVRMRISEDEFHRFSCLYANSRRSSRLCNVRLFGIIPIIDQFPSCINCEYVLISSAAIFGCNTLHFEPFAQKFYSCSICFSGENCYGQKANSSHQLETSNNRHPDGRSRASGSAVIGWLAAVSEPRRGRLD